MKHGKVHKIDYVIGKSRSLEGAESLRERTQEALEAARLPQTARVTKISNGQGTYGFRVNVTSEVTA